MLDVTDPAGDDNGPGTYQYPTDSSFTAGSFDLTDLKVNQDGTNVYIQVSIAKLVPTFGNNFGAQLLDVYVRDPGGEHQRGRRLPDIELHVPPAWSERLEAQGFASPVWVGASGDVARQRGARDRRAQPDRDADRAADGCSARPGADGRSR